MPGGAQRGEGPVELVVAEKEVVRVVRAEGEDPDAGGGQGIEKLLEDAALGGAEGEGDVEEAEAAGGGALRRDEAERRDEGELVRGASEKARRSMESGGRDGGRGVEFDQAEDLRVQM